jgi:hypothetical protein
MSDNIRTPGSRLHLRTPPRPRPHLQRNQTRSNPRHPRQPQPHKAQNNNNNNNNHEDPTPTPTTTSINKNRNTTNAIRHEPLRPPSLSSANLAPWPHSPLESDLLLHRDASEFPLAKRP